MKLMGLAAITSGGILIPKEARAIGKHFQDSFFYQPIGNQTIKGSLGEKVYQNVSISIKSPFPNRPNPNCFLKAHCHQGGIEHIFEESSKDWFDYLFHNQENNEYGKLNKTNSDLETYAWIKEMVQRFTEIAAPQLQTKSKLDNILGRFDLAVLSDLMSDIAGNHQFNSAAVYEGRKLGLAAEEKKPTLKEVFESEKPNFDEGTVLFYNYRLLITESSGGLASPFFDPCWGASMMYILNGEGGNQKEVFMVRNEKSCAPCVRFLRDSEGVLLTTSLSKKRIPEEKDWTIVEARFDRDRNLVSSIILDKTEAERLYKLAEPYLDLKAISR